MGTWNPFSWLSRHTSRTEPTPHGRLDLPSTEFSTTVFTGTAPEWNDYLQIPRADRYDHTWQIELGWDGSAKQLRFTGHNEGSGRLAEALELGFGELRKTLLSKPAVLQVLDHLVFANPSNGEARLTLEVSPLLPSLASREILMSDQLRASEVSIVLDRPSVEAVLRLLNEYPGQERIQVRLGIIWPLLRRVISQLAYPGYPRDRYLERIDLTTNLAFLNLHVLFRGQKKGRLVPTEAGEVYQKYVSKRDSVPEEDLLKRHPYFRMLQNLSFMLRDDWQRDYLDVAKVIVRDYLDTRYVRLGIASVMPEISDSMRPMDLHWMDNGSPKTCRPKMGNFGILNHEDLEAWKEVAAPFRDLGFILVRQLGIGQFGRVYEAVNTKNAAIPRRVAVKVDRIRKRKTEEAILAAETILQIGRDLSYCPHVIRIYDAGKLKKRRHTYHVLQLVDGDTLDNLVGVTGAEHASIQRPQRKRTSSREVQDQAFKALNSSAGEAWRKERVSLPFTRPLSITLALDLITSMLLWVEEIHRLKYVVNDLKNGNLMVSRRGQLKGIDLDSYSPAFGPLDRQMDFFFLSVSLLLFLVHYERRSDPDLSLAGVLTDETKLRQTLDTLWLDTLLAGNPRVSKEFLVDYLTTLLLRCRQGIYSEDPALFTQDIDQLIYLKRSIRGGEIILD